MRFVLALIVVVFFAPPAWAQCDSGEAVLKLGFAEDAAESPRRRFAKSFADSVSAALQGKACVLNIISTTLYEDEKALAAVQSGAIQLAMPSLEKLTVASPRMIVFSLPFAFRDVLALERFAASSAYADILKPLASIGVVPLGLLHEGFAQTAGSRPIHGPEDVRGMRFRRAGAPDPASRPDLLGASAREIKESELTKALAEKQVEAVTGSWAFLAANNVDTALAGATQTNHRYSGFMIVTNKSLWETLDADIRATIIKAASENAGAANAATLATEKVAMDTIIQRGRPVQTLTSKQREAWLEKLRPMWERVARDAQLLLAIRSANAMP